MAKNGFVVETTFKSIQIVVKPYHLDFVSYCLFIKYV